MALSWLSDNDLSAHIGELIDRAVQAREQAPVRRLRNVPDPFGTLIVAASHDVNQARELQSIQDAESSLRGMSNHMGTFHQKVLGSIAGWVNHDAGYDLACDSEKIVAEVKNKWNTLNSTQRDREVEELVTAVRQKGREWKGYLVEVVPRRPERKEELVRGRVYTIDGASMYHVATGDPNAIHDLFDELCAAISPTEEIELYCRNILAGSIPPRIHQ